jgi:hypothetical protein
VGKTNGGCFSFQFLDEDNFKTLADILKVPTIPMEQREQVIAALEDYAASKDEVLPRISTAKQNLLALDKAIGKTIRAFSNLTDFETQSIALKGKDIKEMLGLLDTIPVALKSIQERAEKALAVIDRKTDQGGRPAAIAMNMLITRLAAIYNRITKRRATTTWNSYKNEITGKFPEFVECCLHASGQEYDGYLRGHIRDILKNKKEYDLSNLRRTPTINSTEG